jgi:hypothetical protein
VASGFSRTIIPVPSGFSRTRSGFGRILKTSKLVATRADLHG